METSQTDLVPIASSQIGKRTTRGIALASIRERLLEAFGREEKLSGDEKTARLDLQVAEQLYLLADFALVGLGYQADNTALRLYAKFNNSPYYTFLPDEALARLALVAARQLRPPRLMTGPRVKKLLSTFLHEPIIIPTIERRVFYISNDLFYNVDAEPGEQLVTEGKLPKTAKCFFRLFDCDLPDKDIVAFPQETFNKKFSKQVLSAYDSLLALLERIAPKPEDSFPEASLSATCQDEDPLPRHFSFIEEWANGNPGLYWDLLTIPATIFLKEKPTVSFFLSGSSNNGKSSYLGLIHTMLGSRNTTRVKLSDMDKWHLNTQLQYTLFNAPDDEGDSISPQSAEFFKSIASHGTISLPIMRSQVPMKLNADFMSAHPMNAFPDWGDSSSASALTRRTCLIPFTADFRGKTKVDNFAKRTFTPEVMAKFTGEVLALASFYSNHPLKWSKTTDGAKQQVEAENDSIRLYKQSWEKYFNGFQSIGLIHDDYKCWCKENGYSHASEKSAFQIHWYSYTSNLAKTNLTGADGKPVLDAKGKPIRKNAYMDPNKSLVDMTRASRGLPPLIPMLADTVLPGALSQFGTISSMHYMEDEGKAVGHTQRSAVMLLENMDRYGN